MRRPRANAHVSVEVSTVVSRLLAAIAALALVAGSAAAAGADGGAPGIVEGTVVHGANGVPMPGLTVSLRFDDGKGTPAERTLATDADGHFRFADLPSPRAAGGDEPVYELSAGYAGVAYRTGTFHPVDIKEPVQLRVYDVTGDDPGLRASRTLLILEAADIAHQELIVHELVTLVNPSLQTYAPAPAAGPMALVRFALPPGARGLTPTVGLHTAEMIQVDRGFAILSAIPPGTQEFGFAFRAPYTPGRYGIALAMPYGAGTVRVLVPEDGPAIASPTLVPAADVTLDGKTYHAWTAQDVVPGQTLTFDVLGLPAKPLWRRMLDVVSRPWAAAAALGGFLLIGAGWALGGWRSPRLLRRRPPASAIPASRESVLVQIATLDSAFEAGTVRQADYRRRRAALLARAVAAAPTTTDRRARAHAARRRARRWPPAAEEVVA